MSIYSTEVTSETEESDSPIHHRLLKAYMIALDYIKGDVLEVGCGEGRGINLMMEKAKTFTALDKLEDALDKLHERFPKANFLAGNFPPFLTDTDSFDVVVSFQVIEHIEDDKFFLDEIHRVLRPGGVALITTPNRPFSLTRNPWHVREYTSDELLNLAKGMFASAVMKGIAGNEKVMAYHEKNKKSVEKITRWDVFDLQHRLPSNWLRKPYEVLNRYNRKKLRSGNQDLVTGITHADYILSDDSKNCLDLFLELKK